MKEHHNKSQRRRSCDHLRMSSINDSAKEELANAAVLLVGSSSSSSSSPSPPSSSSSVLSGLPASVLASTTSVSSFPSLPAAQVKTTSLGSLASVAVPPSSAPALKLAALGKKVKGKPKTAKEPKKTSKSSRKSNIKSTKAKNKAKNYRVDIHLTGKNHKFPGHYSLLHKKIIHEWARTWKSDQISSTMTDTRTVLCLRKNQAPQRWTQKDAFWWFHSKSVGASTSAHQELHHLNAVSYDQMMAVIDQP